MKIVRSSIVSALIWSVVAALGASALVGSVSEEPAPIVEEEPLEGSEPLESETPAPEEEEGEEDGEDGEDAEIKDNHGGCVSYWGHKAKAEGLHGRYYGGFVSSVAQSDCVGDDTDFSEQLAAALEEQEAAEAEGAVRGKGKKAPALEDGDEEVEGEDGEVNVSRTRGKGRGRGGK